MALLGVPEIVSAETCEDGQPMLEGSYYVYVIVSISNELCLHYTT